MKAMRKFKNIYWAGMTASILLLSQNIMAQDENSRLVNPASVELLKAKSLWFNTENSAGLTLDKMYDFNNLLFDVNLKEGDFKRKPEGSDERNLGVSTEGGLNLGGGYVWGKFSYNNEKQEGTLYNTTMLDPVRGIPYYPVDKNLSDWVKQDYNLSMKVASKPLWERYIVGIGAQYQTRTGAKQVDPRSETNFYILNVKPALVATFNNHSVGLNFMYERTNQESSTTNSNSQANQDVYVLKGLGYFYSAVVGGLQSLGKFVYDGNKIGGAFQYGYTGESLQLLLDGKYTYGVEDATSTPTKPKKEGSVKFNNYEADLQLLIPGKNLNKVELSWADHNTSGIEYVQVLDKTFEVQRWITTYKSIRSTYDLQEMALKYDFFRGSDLDYKWRTGLIAKYRNSDDVYIFPASEMKIEEMMVGINAKGNLNLGNQNRILGGLSFNYHKNLDGLYVYGGPDPESVIITDFMNSDFNYLKSGYTKTGAEICYFTRIGKNGRTGMFVNGALDYFKPVDSDEHRMVSKIGFGFTF